MLSDTRIWMFVNAPVAVGVPESWPVVVLNAAHDGLFTMLNVSAVAVGVRSRSAGTSTACPTFAAVAGVPLITGAVLAVDVVPETEMLNAGSDAEVTPSDRDDHDR